MVGFTVYTVVMRYVFLDPPVWGDLLTVLSNIWLVFIALALTVREKQHIGSQSHLREATNDLGLRRAIALDRDHMFVGRGHCDLRLRCRHESKRKILGDVVFRLGGWRFCL